MLELKATNFREIIVPTIKKTILFSKLNKRPFTFNIKIPKKLNKCMIIKSSIKNSQNNKIIPISKITIGELNIKHAPK